jgi:hypothetical protein
MLNFFHFSLAMTMVRATAKAMAMTNDDGNGNGDDLLLFVSWQQWDNSDDYIFFFFWLIKMQREFVDSEVNGRRERKSLLFFCDGDGDGYVDNACNRNKNGDNWFFFAS